MGINKSVIRFTGKVGGLIGYKRNGKYCIRTAPEVVRQTQATRHAAKWFGAASRKGALIRGAILPDLDILCDGGYVNQLNRAILKAGRNNHAGLTGFRFNKHKSAVSFFSSTPAFTEDGKLRIPAQELVAPPGCIRMEVKLIGTRIDFPSQKVTGSDATALYIDLKQRFTPFEGAELSVDVPGNGTLLVTLQVRMFMEEGVSLNRTINAADIIAVVETKPLEAPAMKSGVHRPLPQRPPAPAGNPAPQAEGQTFPQRE